MVHVRFMRSDFRVTTQSCLTLGSTDCTGTSQTAVLVEQIYVFFYENVHDDATPVGTTMTIHEKIRATVRCIENKRSQVQLLCG